MVHPYPNKVIVSDIESGEIVDRGIYMLSDDRKSEGVRARWAKVHAIGDGVVGLSVGDWVLVKHGRWTRGVNVDGVELRMVDYPEATMMVVQSEDLPSLRSVGLKKQTEVTINPDEFRDYAKDKLI